MGSMRILIASASNMLRSKQNVSFGLFDQDSFRF